MKHLPVDACLFSLSRLASSVGRRIRFFWRNGGDGGNGGLHPSALLGRGSELVPLSKRSSKHKH